MNAWEWFWLAVIIAWIPRSIYRATLLQRALRAEGYETRVNLRPLLNLFMFRRQWRKAQWEYIREQEEYRNGNKRLRSLGDRGDYVSNWMDFVRLSGPTERGQ
jgi:hypothetical protein